MNRLAFVALTLIAGSVAAHADYFEFTHTVFYIYATESLDGQQIYSESYYVTGAAETMYAWGPTGSYGGYFTGVEAPDPLTIALGYGNWPTIDVNSFEADATGSWYLPDPNGAYLNITSDTWSQTTTGYNGDGFYRRTETDQFNSYASYNPPYGSQTELYQTSYTVNRDDGLLDTFDIWADTSNFTPVTTPGPAACLAFLAPGVLLFRSRRRS